jgi:hypothetical protein
MSHSVAGGFGMIAGGMQNLAVNSNFLSKSIWQASKDFKAAAMSVGGVSKIPGPSTLTDPNSSYPVGIATGSHPGVSGQPYDPWKNTAFAVSKRTGTDYGSNSLQLQVNVNNADANEIADKMVETWRSRGVDL